jgi:PAS domain S-box-containing protein
MEQNSNYGNFYIPKLLNSTTKIVGITAILYFLIAKLSLFIFVTEINILPFFPAMGFAIAAIILFGRKVIFGVAIGCLLFSISLYKNEFQNATTFEELIKPIALCVVRPIIASLNAFLVSHLIQLWCKKKHPLESKKNVISFILATLLGTFLSVSIGFITLAMTSYIPLDNCILTWSNMLRGNIMGVIIFTPFVLSWLSDTKEFSELSVAKKAEVFFLIITTLSLSLFVFETRANNESILFFLLIWAASRYGMKIITLVVIIITIIAIYCTGHNMGGFVFSGWNMDFFMLQLFLFVNMVSVLFLKAILHEKEREEYKLKLSEEKFRSIYENSLDIYFRKDLDGILLEIGPSVEKHLHRTQEFMIGKNVKDFYYDPADGVRFYEIIHKEQQIYDYEELFLTPTGELVYFSVNAKLVYDSDGKPLFVEGTKRNISERIFNEKQLLKANERIKESEEKFRAIYENSLDIYFKRDLEGNLIDVSPSIEKHFDMKREFVIGKNANDFFVNRAEAELFYEAILKNKQVNDYEERFVTASGDIVYFSVTAKVVYNSDGEPIYFEGTMRNVNERIQNRKKLLEATQKIKESEEKFRSIYENSLDIYFKKDLDGIILEIGPSVDKHLLQKRDSMIGKNIRDYYYDSIDVERFYEIILKEQQIIDYQEQFINALGDSVYLSVNAKLVYDSDGEPIYVEGTRRNISERILNEKNLLEATEKIKDSEEKYRSIFENMQDIYYMHTLDGKLLDISPSVEKNLLYKREEMIGRDTIDFHYDKSRQSELREKITRDGFITDELIQFVTASGESVYFSVNCKVIYDQNGQKKHVEGSMRNIDERINNQKQLLAATEKIKESEEKYRSIFENTQDVYYMHNLDGKIFEVSPSVEKHFKYKREEMIGMYTGDLYHDPSKQNYFREKITRYGFLNDEHVQFVTATGEPIYFSLTNKIIFDKNGVPSHVEGSMRNINDRIINQNKLLEAAEKIKESEEKFRSIYENMQDLYFMHELGGKILDINPAAEKIFQRKRDEVIGLNVQSFYSDPTMFDEIKIQFHRDGFINDQEVQFVIAGGEIAYFSVNAKLTFNRDLNCPVVEGTMRNINERIINQKQLLDASEKIRESEEKFRSIYENIEDVYFLHDLNGTIIDVSPSAEKAFQKKREDFIGTNAQSLQVNTERYDEVMAKLHKDGFVNDQEVQFLTATGETVYFSVNAKLINKYECNCTLVEGTMRNINERIINQKQLLEASEKIKESEEKFRSIFENMQDVYYLHTLDGVLLNTSPSVEKYFNKKREDLIGDKVQKLFTDPLRYDELTEITLLNGFINDQEVEFITETGEKMYFSVNSKLIYDSNGVPILAEGTMRNISERIINQNKLIEATEKIKQSEEEYRSIFESFEDVYFRSTLDGHFQNVSPSVEKILKYKREDVVGTLVTNYYLYPEERTKAVELIIQNGYINDFETIFKDKDNNPVHLSVNGHLIYDSLGNAKYLEGTIRDINERKNNELKIEIANQAIKESEKKYRTIFESVRDIFFRASAKDHKIIDISPSCSYFDLKPEEIIGRSIEEFYANPEDRIPVLNELKQKGEINNYDIQLLLKSKICTVSINSKITYDQNNEPEFMIGSFRDVSDRVQAEENLKISEAKFRSIYENFEDVYYKTELNGTVIDLSPSFERNFKMKRSDVIGTSTSFTYRNQVDQAAMRFMLKENGYFVDFDTQYIDGEGNMLFMSINGRVVYDSNGEPHYVEGTMRNINERIYNQNKLLEATEKIRQSEEEFRSIFESFEDVYFRSSLEGLVYNISPSVEKIFKYKREEIIGTISTVLYYYPEDSNKIMTALDEKGYIKDFETIFKDKENNTIYVSVDVHFTYDSMGNAMFIEGIVRDISERKQSQLEIEKANQAIKESEEEFRTIFESFEDLYFRNTLDGIIQNVSPSIEKMLKYKREEVINTNTANLYLYDGDRSKMLEGIKKDGHINDFETILMDKENNPVYASINAHFVYDSHGNATFIEGTIRDISERKKNELEIEIANQAIKESEQKYRTIFESVRDVFFRASAKDHKIIDISPSCSYFGLEPQELIGKSLGEFYVNPEDRIPVLKELEQNGELNDCTAKVLIKSKIYTISTNSKISYDENNEPEFQIGSFRDISDRIQAEENLKISETKFRSIYENFEDVYFKTQLDGTIIDLSPSFERNFKMPCSEGLGKSTLDFYYHTEDRERAIDLLSRNENLNDFDAQFVDGEGNLLFFSVNARLIRDSYGKAAYFEGTMRNVNERSMMQEEMLAKNRTLEFQNTELEQFAYIASHDLQEPLITVIHCIELLQEGLYDNLDEDQKQYLEFINSSTSRMQQLVKGLLDYSRIGKGRKNSQIDCNEIIANVLSDMNASLKESNAIVEYENLPTIQGYTTEIRQLFQNIISNANKFRKKDQQPKIKITAVQEESNWVFSIEDNGIGIEDEDKDKVFVIFKRLHNRNEYHGTGIGLSHCKKIVEHHNGTIWVESEPNEGSTFKWTFPIELN